MIDFELASREWRENRGKLPPSSDRPVNLEPSKEVVPTCRLSVMRDGDLIYLAWSRSGDGSVDGSYDDTSDPIFPMTLQTAAGLAQAIADRLHRPDGYSDVR